MARCSSGSLRHSEGEGEHLQETQSAVWMFTEIWDKNKEQVCIVVDVTQQYDINMKQKISSLVYNEAEVQADDLSCFVALHWNKFLK